MSDISAPRRRPLWGLFILPVLLLIAAVVWSGFWFYAASQVGERADAWRAQEAKSGRNYDCAKRSVAGYPFRLEVRCEGASVSLVSQTASNIPFTAKLGEILVVAQIYDPQRVIAEFASPASIAIPEQQPLRVDWSKARASVVGLPAVPQRGSIVFDDVAHRPRQQHFAAGAGRARQTCRTARPSRRGFADRPSGDRSRAAAQRGQRAGRASRDGRALQCRRPRKADGPEGFFAKTLAGAVSRDRGRRAARSRSCSRASSRAR